MSSATNTSTLSDTLNKITRIKIAELEKKHNAYNAKKQAALDITSVDKHDFSARVRTQQLAENVSGMNVPFIDDQKLKNVLSYLEQARVDPSVSVAEISTYEQWLLDHLNHQSNRLSHATLFSAVLSEHLDLSTEVSSHESGSSTDGDDSLDGPYEVLTRDRLQQLREKFEDVVFNEHKTDERAIHDYLRSLFPTEELKTKMNGLRARLKRDTDRLFRCQRPFNERVLEWVIRGLLHNDLLGDDQKTLLKNFRQDDLVRAELCDVLNMRWAELRTWQWTEDGSALHVEPRKQLNGKYRVVMQEDILQSMLVHFIGVKLCVNAKEELDYWLEEVMQMSSPLTDDERDRRKFYTRRDDELELRKSLMPHLNDDYLSNVLLSHLPSHVGATGGYDDDEDATEKDGNKRSWLQVKQHLLHHVASKILIDRKLYGDVAVVQTDLQWFATSIPHSTVYAVLKFCGLSDNWLDWFRKYLEVPLNMTKVAGEEQQIRKRKRGIPIAHALEKYLGEMILVFLDIAVKNEADLQLYRMHDDIMLCGPTKQCEKAWEVMQNFVQIMGLEFNQRKTGSISLNATTSQKARLPAGDVAIDFLKLSSDRGLWIIDNEKVNNHTRQLKKQLDESEDILSFIRTYNSCIGRFFGHTFGPPACCLGPKHVQDILETHHRIQKELFGDAGITAVLKDKLQSLTHTGGLPDGLKITDSFIHSPILLGGLGVTNPFIPLLLVRKGFLGKTPEQHVDDYLDTQKTYYNSAKRGFESESLSSRKKRLAKVLETEDSRKIAESSINLDKYWSFEDWLKYPEWTSSRLLDLYKQLMSKPTQSPVLMSSRVTEELARLTEKGAKHVSLKDLTVEEQYKVQMFSEEIFNTFGTLAIVDRTLAPLGVMKAIMGEKVTWQMVL